VAADESPVTADKVGQYTGTTPAVDVSAVPDVTIIKPKDGAPSTVTRPIFRRVIARIREGMSTRQALETEGVTRQAFFRLIAKQSELAVIYSEAKAAGLDFLVDSVHDIAAETPPITDKGAMDTAFVNWQRVRIDTIRWIAKTINPTKYGDRVIAAGDPNQPIEYKWADTPQNDPIQRPVLEAVVTRIKDERAA